MSIASLCQVQQCRLAEDGAQTVLVLYFGTEEEIPDGEGVARTGSRPRTMAHCRAVARPSSFHERELLLT